MATKADDVQEDRRGKGPRKFATQRNRIRELRQRAGMRAADVADRMEKLGHGKASGSSILKIEKGWVALNDRWRRGIAAALGVAPEELELEDDGVPVLKWSEIAGGRRGQLDDREYIGWRGSAVGMFAVRARAADVHDDPPIREGDILVCRTPHDDGTATLVVAADDNGALVIGPPDADTVPVGEVVEIRHRLSR
jgi:transcriptional regulator with XRE-family HTH domain